MEEMNEHRPEWMLKGDRIDEVVFAREFLYTRALKSCHGSFYGINGRISDEQQLRREIYQRIQPYVTTSLSKKVSSLLETIRMECQVEAIPIQEGLIHVANGTYSLKKGYTTDFSICRNRLPVYYDEHCGYPEKWMAFLEELLEEQDIDTLQEYMGYCLLPITVGQKMLILTGDGGEGKSRIGVVMKAIFGDSMGVGSLNKIETSPFARADLEDLLVFVDDDLKMERLAQTNYLKTIITAETDMDLERKGRQSYQGRLYTRLMAFGNTSLQAINDRSYGFFRRQIILTTKPRRPDRVDDPFLAKRLLTEKNAIFMWALGGLLRLHGSGYRFTISDRTRRNLETAISQSDNVGQFLGAEGYLVRDPQGEASSRALYQCYCQWCAENSVFTLPARSFSDSFARHAQKAGFLYCNNIRSPEGRRVWGYRGIRLTGPEKEIPANG